MKIRPDTEIGWEKGTLRDLIEGLSDLGDSPAILTSAAEGDSSLSYGELAAQVEELAGGLLASGFGPGKRIAIMAPNGPAWIVTCLAGISAGSAVVPLDMQLDPESLAHVLSDSRPDLVFAARDAAERISDSPAGASIRIARLDAESGESFESWRDFLTGGPSDLPPLQPEDTATIFYTSGTTGPPKGVPLSHRNIMFELWRLREIGLMRPGERLLLPLPMHHVYPFVVGFLGALTYGVGIVFPQSITGPHILDAIRRYDVATVIGVPRFYDALMSAVDRQVRSAAPLAGPVFNALLAGSIATKRATGLNVGRYFFRPLHRKFGASLRLLASGGAALEPALAWKMEGMGWTVASGYGLTETSPMISILRPEERRFDTVGKPLAGVELRIAPLQADAEESEASGAEPEIGEIQVRGPNVFRGYLNLPDRTAEAFTGDGWYRTEDRGAQDRDEYLRVFGRASTFVVTPAGENISLEELEKAYEKHPRIREIGIFMRDGKLLAVAVPERAALRGQKAGSAEDSVREAIGERGRRLASYKRLGEVVVSRSALQRTRLGKIRRNSLVELFDAIRKGGGEAAARKGPMPVDEMSGEDQALLEHPKARALWDMLAVRFGEMPLTPDSDVTLDLGIDSLAWIDVTLEVADRTGVSLSEEATGRIETVRDLLREVVDQAGRAEGAVADFAAEPERYITEHQKAWLRPLNPAETALAWMLYWINRVAMRTLFRLHVDGVEHLDAERAVVIAPNHLSVLDPFAIAAAIPYPIMRRTSFAGWTGMAFANPLYRLIARLARTLPVEHGQAAFSSIALPLEMLRRGQNIVWFPEGGRSVDGELQPFQQGTGILIERSDKPALPVAIRGTYEAMPYGRRLPRLRRIEVDFGRLLLPAELTDSGKGKAERERLVDGLRKAVAALQAKGP